MSELSTFFQATLEAFGRAPAAQSLRCRLGPVALELHCAGALPARDWIRPLALRELPGEERPQARIFAWDDSLENSRVPPPPWADRFVFNRRGEPVGYSSERFRAAYNFDARLLTLWDRQTNTGIYWARSAGLLPEYEWTAPMRTLIHWMGLPFGLQLTHAAVVGSATGAVVLAGKGGSGKSTTALACWQAGMQLVGDDYCWLEAGTPPRAYAVYRSARLCPNPALQLPDWTATPHWTQEKLGLDLARLATGPLAHCLPLSSVLLPRVISGSRLLIEEAAPEEGVRALALTTVGQLAGAGADTVSRLREIAGALPCHRLGLVPPASAVAAAVAEILGKPEALAHV